MEVCICKKTFPCDSDDQPGLGTTDMGTTEPEILYLQLKPREEAVVPEDLLASPQSGNPIPVTRVGRWIISENNHVKTKQNKTHLPGTRWKVPPLCHERLEHRYLHNKTRRHMLLFNDMLRSLFSFLLFLYNLNVLITCSP